jgi:hypothetical protein
VDRPAAGDAALARAPPEHAAKGSARCGGGFPALLICVVRLGMAFGAAGVIVPAYATSTAAGTASAAFCSASGVWAARSAASGSAPGGRRCRCSKQFAWLLGAVAASFLVLTVMPSPLWLGMALVLGGATIAPALTVENTLVGRLAPAAMLNEAYTWIVTVSVAAARRAARWPG